MQPSMKTCLSRRGGMESLIVLGVLWAGCATTGDQGTVGHEVHPQPPTAAPAQPPPRPTQDGKQEGPATQPTAGPLPAEKAATKKLSIPTQQAVIMGRVLDAATKRPVAGAMVLYGSCGTDRARTDSQGRYHMTVSWGSVYLHVEHRAYKSAQARFQAPRGARITRDFSLTKKPGPPSKIVQIRGRVTEIVHAPGTRSEYREVVLTPSGSSGRKMVLFDISGCTAPLAKWVGKSVVIRGYHGTGSVGWMHRPAPGLIVESIVEITPGARPRP